MKRPFAIQILQRVVFLIYENIRTKNLEIRNHSYTFATKLFVDTYSMNNKPPIKMRPTDSELEILQVLWQQGPCTVRQVNDRLAENKDVGYTTTLKLMQIMHEKNLLTRLEESRSHVYEAAVGEEQTQATLLERFVGTAFRGSTTQLVLQALGNHKATTEELNQIRQLLNQIEKQP